MRGRGKTKAQLVEELEALRWQQRALLESTSDAIITTDLAFVIQSWNRGAEVMYGWRADEAIGRRIYELMPPEYTDQTDENARARLRDTGVWSGEVIQTRKDGCRVTVHATVNIVADNAGRATSVISITRDITARKCAETKLAESEAQFRGLAERTVIGIYIIQDGVLAYVNPSFAAMFGYAREEIVGTLTPRDLIHPDDIDVAMKRLCERQAAATGTPSAVYRGLRKDGSLIYVEAHGQRMELEGKPAVFGSLIDVTERRRIEAVLRESQARLRRAQRIAHMGHWARDIASGETTWSAGVFHILGLEPQAATLSPSTLSEYIHPEDRGMVRRAFEAAVAGTGRYDVEYRALSADGSVRWVHSQADVSRDRDGQPTHVFGTVLDVTEQRKLREDLLEIASEERRRVGRELHDGIGQDLAGASFLAAALAYKLEAQGSPTVSDARLLEGLLSSVVVKGRQLARGLYPVALDMTGLEGAFEELAEGTSRVFAVRCTAAVDPDICVKNREVAEHVYRIAHEAVMNAVLHGEPTTVSIELLTARPGEALLVVTDDGTGLPSTTAPGTGIRIMEFRARTIGGLLQVRAGPAGGTEVRCGFPTTAAETP